MSALKKAINLATLKNEAQTKVGQHISVALSTLRRIIGEELYASFIALPDDEFVYGEVGYVPYENLTSDGKKRRDLETAQAYLMLYHAVPGLKDIDMGTVVLDRLSFGQGDVEPSTASSLEKYQKMFWKMAVDICSVYTGVVFSDSTSAGFSCIVI